MKHTNIRFMHQYCNSIAKKFRASPCKHAVESEYIRKLSPDARKPKQPIHGYALVNGEDMHRLHPETFDLHSLADRINAKVGRHVKVGLIGPTKDEPSERFWVSILSKTATSNGATFIGQVHAALCFTAEHGISDGNIVQFGTEHILVIEL